MASQANDDWVRLKRAGWSHEEAQEGLAGFRRLFVEARCEARSGKWVSEEPDGGIASPEVTQEA